MAKKLGATHVFNSADPAFVENVKNAVGLVDASIDWFALLFLLILSISLLPDIISVRW
jgi:Zn-dependent alcohol dehydrogenase